MRKVILYIAMSLDGYIADSKGNVDWLEGQGSEENVDTYTSFSAHVDTVIMGKNTYKQIVNELSPKEWVYESCMSYVITHECEEKRHHIQFVNENPASLIKSLKQKEEKDIWVCGGANIIKQVMEEDLIDVYHLTIIPTILGQGIALFAEFEKEKKLTLLSTQNYNGMIEAIYERR